MVNPQTKHGRDAKHAGNIMNLTLLLVMHCALCIVTIVQCALCMGLSSCNDCQHGAMHPSLCKVQGDAVKQV